MKETVESLLARMRDRQDLVDYEIADYCDRLSAAHSAEVAERDARIGSLRSRWIDDESEYRARAEAAERDAREAVGLLMKALPYLEDHCDEGPHGEGWKSGGLESLIAAIAQHAQVGGGDGK